MKDILKNIFYFIYDLFTEHPKSNGESYILHMYFALKISILCLLASCFLIIHSIFPFLFKYTGSFLIEYAYDICNRRISTTKGGWPDDDGMW